MTSPQKRAANKRNALKSTGPRGVQGRRRACLNATKHGLSVPLDEFFWPQMAAIAALVRPECSSEEDAVTLARRILDLERNESVQRGYLQEEACGVLLEDPRVWSHQQQVEATRQKFSEFDEVQDFLDQFTATGEDHPLDLPRVARFRRKMVQTVYVQSKGEYFKAQRLRAQSLRYLRRAGNQLVKGVRSLARTTAG